MEQNEKAIEIYKESLNQGTIYKSDLLLADSMVIPEYNLKEITEIKGGVIAMVAPTSSGKTYLLRDLLANTHKNYDQFFIFSGTATLQKDYDFFPRNNIYKNYDEAKMKEIWDTNYDKKPEDRENILIILDDIIADPEFIKGKMLNKMAISSRHIAITVIILVQYLTSLKPIVRQNLRLIIAFETDSYKERKKFVEEFLSLTNSRVGDLIYTRITKVPYQAIIVAIYKKDKASRVYKYIAKQTNDAQLKLKNLKSEELFVEAVVRRK